MIDLRPISTTGFFILIQPKYLIFSGSMILKRVEFSMPYFRLKSALKLAVFTFRVLFS